MAAVESLKGKSIETVKLSYLPAYPGAISWSLDGRISVITDQCVYVLTPISSNVNFGLNLQKTFIPSLKKRWMMEVDVDRQEITQGKCSGYVWCVDPQVNTSLLESSGFENVAWSPLNCDKNGRCVAATISSDHQLCIHLSPTLGVRWKEACNLSQVLCSHVTTNNFKIDQDVMQSDAQEAHQQKQMPIDNSRLYFKFTQRTQILKLTSLHWFSEIYHTGGDVSCTELGSSVDDNQFAVLVTGNRSGHVIFWKVPVPIMMNPTGIELGGFLNTHQTWPCSLSWQSIAENQGLLAVGSTDGFVKVFSIRVVPSITGVAQYVLWGDKDDMQVQWLEWMPSSQVINRGYRLVVCKGSSVIIFSMSVKGNVLSQKPTHRIITEVHRMPITGLACVRDGTIFTCSLDGSVQMVTADEKPARSVDYNAKRKFLCKGIGVSANAAFIALFLTPSNYLCQNQESHQTQILFVNIAGESSSITRLLNSKHVQMENKWDVCKAIHFFIDQGKNMIEEIHQLASTEDLNALSSAQLILRQHLLSLMVLLSLQDECHPSMTQTDWSAHLECTLNCMYKHLATATLESWLEGHEAGTVNQSDTVSVLLLCDWLIMKHKDPAALDLVTKVYQACSDTAGLKMVSVLQGQSQDSAKIASSPRSGSDGLQMQTTTQGDNSEAKSNGRETASELMVDAAVLEGGCQSGVSFLAREKCPICESAIPVESLNYGICFNGHKWQRCCVSFTVCADLVYKCCQDCCRCVSIPRGESSAWMDSLLRSTSKCPFCLGFFRTSA